MGSEVLLGHDLPTGGTDLAVELQTAVAGAGLPGALLVFLMFATGLLLQGLEIPMSSKELPLLLGVWEEHQELVEDPLEVLPQKIPTTLVVLCRRDDALKDQQQRSLTPATQLDTL